jgi:hypothetical protein
MVERKRHGQVGKRVSVEDPCRHLMGGLRFGERYLELPALKGFTQRPKQQDRRSRTRHQAR